MYSNTNNKSQTNQKSSQSETKHKISNTEQEFIQLVEDLPPSHNRKYLHNYIDNFHDIDIIYISTELIKMMTPQEQSINYEQTKLANLGVKT